MGWIIYAGVVLAVSGLIGMHLGRFREAYTEMLGMMVGMTMGMLNGFLLGYAAAAVTNSMFWGNLSGILLGLALGVYFGRPGGLMGLMDGGMGGVMGGSMGAMLAVMVAFPRDAQLWTGALLGGIYVMGMVSLVVLIERSAPGHAALHRLAPFFTKAISTEVSEVAEVAEVAMETADTAPRHRDTGSFGVRASLSNGNLSTPRKLVDYYALLNVTRNAGQDEITEAYLEQINSADPAKAAKLERALTVLTNSQRRGSYDRKLVASETEWNSNLSASPHATLSSSQGFPRRATATVSVKAPVPQVTHQEAVQAAGAAGAAAGGINHENGGSRDGGRSSRSKNGRTTGAPTSPMAPSGNGQRRQGTSTADVIHNPGGASPSRGKDNRASDGKASKSGTKKQTSGDRQAPQKQQVHHLQKQQPARKNTVVSVSWVGGLAFLVILGAIGWWIFTAASARPGATGVSSSGSAPNAVVGASGETEAQLEGQAVLASVGTDGKQTVDVVLDSATFQYKPKAIKVKQGIPVRFNLSVENGDPG